MKWVLMPLVALSLVACGGESSGVDPGSGTTMGTYATCSIVPLLFVPRVCTGPSGLPPTCTNEINWRTPFDQHYCVRYAFEAGGLASQACTKFLASQIDKRWTCTYSCDMSGPSCPL